MVLEAVILTQLKAFRAVPRRRVAPVLHRARFYRKMPAHLQGCRILGAQSDSPVSKPVGSSLVFGEPAVRFYLIVEVPVH